MIEWNKCVHAWSTATIGSLDRGLKIWKIVLVNLNLKLYSCLETQCAYVCCASFFISIHLLMKAKRKSLWVGWLFD